MNGSTDPRPPKGGRESAGRFDGMFDVVDAGGDTFHEMPARLGQADTARMAFEQEDAEVFFLCPDPGADAGLADAAGVCRMVEVQILGDRQGLDQRHHGNARAKANWRLPCLRELVAPPHHAKPHRTTISTPDAVRRPPVARFRIFSRLEVVSTFLVLLPTAT